MRRLIVLLAALLSSGCIKHMIINSAADALTSEGGGGWGTDDDPELIASATPFALKTIEGLVQAEPENPKLLLAACSGFAQYGYAFVQQPADQSPDLKSDQLEAVHRRAAKLLHRAEGYCWRGLEAKHEGTRELWKKDHDAAMKQMEKEDVPLLYWTAASLALQISLQKDRPEMLAELPAVGSLGERALALDEAWDHGSIHELLEAYESARPAAAGGSPEKAKVHMDRALALSENKKLGPLVTWAESVEVAKQNKEAFLKLLDQVLAFDVDSAPEYRLANILAQRKAAWLKAHLDDLFA